MRLYNLLNSDLSVTTLSADDVVEYTDGSICFVSSVCLGVPYIRRNRIVLTADRGKWIAYAAKNGGRFNIGQNCSESQYLAAEKWVRNHIIW